MRFLLSLVGVVLGSALFIAPGYGDPGHVVGIVEVVDTQNLTVVVKTNRGVAHAFSVTDATVIEKLRKGDRVTAEVDDQGIARKVTTTDEAEALIPVQPER